MDFLRRTFHSDEQAEPEAAAEPLILNRYRPLGEAGKGGFGTVQLAYDTRIHRRVAVKCMDVPAALQMDCHNSNVFDELAPSQIPGLEEARTAAMLAHPNIVQVYDFEVQDGVAYLIMEFVDGMTLADLLKSAGDNMTLDMVTAVFAGVASALEFAHENQVLHLDIKPANILIDRQGQVKVTDFGLARLSGVWGYSAASGGTIGYMPPEQMRQEPLDVRCDEWALASVLYEMVSGRNPFLARDIPSAIQAIETAEIVVPSLCMEGLSPASDDAFFYALDPDRNERYASVRDFDEELRPYMGDAELGRRQMQTALGDYLVDDGSLDDGGADWTSGFSALVPHFNGSWREKLSGKIPGIALRVWALLTALAAAVAELPTFEVLGGWTSPVFMAAFAGMLALAFVLPKVGALISLALLAVTLALHGAYLPAAAVAVMALAWWGLVGGHGPAQANAGTLPFLAGAIGLNQIIPLVSGFFLPVADAAKSAVCAWVLAVFLAGFGSNTLLGWNVNLGTFEAGILQHNLQLILSDPGTYAVLASWLLAAVLTSAFVKRGSRAMVLVGVGLGAAALVAGAMGVTGLATHFASWVPNPNFLIPTIIGAVLVGVMGWLFVPEREDLG